MNHRYKITLKNPNGGFTFLMERIEMMKKEVETDSEGNDTIIEVPTGIFSVKEFVRDNFEDAKSKYIELLETHLPKDINIVDDCEELLTYNVELKSESVEEPVESDEV